MLDTRMECCPECTSRQRQRKQSLLGMTYHDFQADSTIFTAPDLIVAFNSGMAEEETESWQKTLKVILDINVPAMFTSYQKDEADNEYAILQSLNARTLTDKPVRNPFAVQLPEIEPGYWYGSKKEPFFHNSMYCVCFQGRCESN
jgi:splicing suppressor protein 51